MVDCSSLKSLHPISSAFPFKIVQRSQWSICLGIVYVCPVSSSQIKCFSFKLYKMVHMFSNHLHLSRLCLYSHQLGDKIHRVIMMMKMDIYIGYNEFNDLLIQGISALDILRHFSHWVHLICIHHWLLQRLLLYLWVKR